MAPPGNWVERWWFWGRKRRLNPFSTAMRHSGSGGRWGHRAGQGCGKNAPWGNTMRYRGGWPLIRANTQQLGAKKKEKKN